MLVTIVDACLRAGRGGSPTAVLEDAELTDEERRAIPVARGTSHAVFVSSDGGTGMALRFFTAAGELPACGHGTVAALAYLAERAGFPDGDAERTVAIRTATRAFTGRVTRMDGQFNATFEPGDVELGEDDDVRDVLDVLDALGVTAATLAPGACVASLGRPRLLVPVSTPAALAALAPDLDRLRAACDRHGLLGCYVHSVPTADGRLAARMFAPSIGVPEDIANANSTACLAAHLARQGVTDITVDMGDTLDQPATITAGTHPSPDGSRVHVGGVARIASKSL